MVMDAESYWRILRNRIKEEGRPREGLGFFRLAAIVIATFSLPIGYWVYSGGYKQDIGNRVESTRDLGERVQYYNTDLRQYSEWVR